MGRIGRVTRSSSEVSLLNSAQLLGVISFTNLATPFVTKFCIESMRPREEGVCEVATCLSNKNVLERGGQLFCRTLCTRGGHQTAVGMVGDMSKIFIFGVESSSRKERVDRERGLFPRTERRGGTAACRVFLSG